MRWGYNRTLDPMQIEAVPMTNTFGTFFLALALEAKASRSFRAAGGVKDSLRAALGPRAYARLRRHLLGSSSGGRR
jgi:hypothetical protein